MPHIFIDSNIYLRLYADDRIAPLIAPLQTVRANVLVTQQIVDEVSRNRVGTIAQFFKTADTTSATRRLSAPSHLLDGEKTKPLSDKLDSHNKEHADLVKAIDELTTSAVLNTSFGQDAVTAALRKFFGTPNSPTSDQRVRAERRRLHGNPPGKADDPLGDQLNWEQFLDGLGGASRVWIVTADGDFVVIHKRTSVLNGYLYDELKGRGVKEVFCFQTLSEALRHIASESGTGLHSLPTSDALNDAATAERHVQSITGGTMNTHGLTYGMGIDICPKCNGKMSPVGLFGGTTWAQRCTQCGLRWDTGEDIED